MTLFSAICGQKREQGKTKGRSEVDNSSSLLPGTCMKVKGQYQILYHTWNTTNWERHRHTLIHTHFYILKHKVNKKDVREDVVIVKDVKRKTVANAPHVRIWKNLEEQDDWKKLANKGFVQAMSQQDHHVQLMHLLQTFSKLKCLADKYSKYMYMYLSV